MIRRWISTDKELIELYGALSGYNSSPELAQVIFEFKDGLPIAAALYDGFNGQSIHTHMWIKKGEHPSRIWWWAVHDYVFNQLGCKKAIGVIKSTNKRAVHLAISMGYQLEGRIKDYYKDGHALFFVGTEETARFWQQFRNGKKPPMYKETARTEP